MKRLLLLLFLAPALHGVTYVVPSDAELIQGADDIVVATGVASFSEPDARGRIVTRVTLRIEEVLKGPRIAGSHLVLTEPGGAAGGRSRVIFGAPRYDPGQRYLVFTSTNRDLEPTTSGLSLGRFVLTDGLALRADIHGFDRNLSTHSEPARDARRFIGFIREIVAGRYADSRYLATVAAATVATDAVLQYKRNSWLLEDGGPGYRWIAPAQEWVRNGTQPGTGDVATAFGQGLGEWNSTDSDIALRDGGVDADALDGLDLEDGRNAVLFNDPNDEIADGSGVVGIGGAFGGDEYTYEGERFAEIVEGDVVVANGTFTQSCLNTILTHELGHALGFRHSNAAPAGFECHSTAHCTSNAIMNGGIQCSWNGVIRDWDHNAAASVYGEGVECLVPSITRQPGAVTVRKGEIIRLSVRVTGTEPIRFEWYEGLRGDRSRPVGTGARELILPAGRAASTQFWVRISNECHTLASENATVTVAGPVRRRSTRH